MEESVSHLTPPGKRNQVGLDAVESANDPGDLNVESGLTDFTSGIDGIWNEGSLLRSWFAVWSVDFSTLKCSYDPQSHSQNSLCEMIPSVVGMIPGKQTV